MKKYLPKPINNASGFTLIELLVVISIIAFLSIIGIAAFTQTQKTARDGRRKADIDAVAKAMETNYNAISGTYSALLPTSFSSNAIPTDPSTSMVYTATLVTPTGGIANQGFWTCADVELNQGNASAQGSGTAYPTFVTTNNGDFYCRASQQNK